MFHGRNLGLVATLVVVGSLLTTAPVLAENLAAWQLGDPPGHLTPGECRSDARCIADIQVVPGRSQAAADFQKVLDFENEVGWGARRAPMTPTSIEIPNRQQQMLDFLNTSWTSAGRTVSPSRGDPSRLINALNHLWSR